MVASCNDYVDINTSPNGPDVTQLKPNNLFGGAISETFRIQSTDMIKLGAFFTNYTATNSALYGNGNDAEMSLALTPSFYPGIWNSTYRGVANLQKIINEGTGDARYTYYVGMSYIMKVFIWSLLLISMEVLRIAMLFSWRPILHLNMIKTQISTEQCLMSWIKV